MSEKEFFDGKKKATNSITVFGKTPKKPVTKANNDTDDKDVTAGIKGGQSALGDSKVTPVGDPTKNVCVKAPVEKNPTEGLTLKFDSIYKQLFEANDIDDTPIGGNVDDPSANLDGDSFDDEAGDLDPIDDEGSDDDLAAGTDEDPMDVLREIRDRISAFLGDEDDDDSALLDDTEADPEDIDDMSPPPGEATPPPPAPATPAAPQNESWQRKTALGPKMSDKAPGKLGKRKGGKTGKGSLKRNYNDAKGKKVPLSKFSPKMSDKVSRLKKGDLF